MRSAPTAIVKPTAGLPQNTALPEITGPAPPGNTMTASNGTWTGSPAGYAYQWYACAVDIDQCFATDGATAATLRLPWDSPSTRLRVVVTATNAAGSVRAVSDRNAFLAKLAVYELPKISGAATVGQRSPRRIRCGPVWPGAGEAAAEVPVASLQRRRSRVSRRRHRARERAAVRGHGSRRRLPDARPGRGDDRGERRPQLDRRSFRGDAGRHLRLEGDGAATGTLDPWPRPSPVTRSSSSTSSRSRTAATASRASTASSSSSAAGFRATVSAPA